MDRCPDGVRPGVDIGARFDQRRDAVEAAMLDGYMKGSLIPHGQVRICVMRRKRCGFPTYRWAA